MSGNTSGAPIVWLTGLPSAGKTTLARLVEKQLTAAGHKVEILDGDAVRLQISRDLGFSRADRDENIRRIGVIAGMLSRNGIIVLVSAVSPYRDARKEVRDSSREFVEVYVNAPLDVCEQRDVKGLYRRARAGELPSLTGIGDPYEPPRDPEIECRTDVEGPAESAAKIVAFVLTRLPN